MISPWMRLEEIFLRCPETIRVFAKYGLACPGCSLAAFDTLERGAKAHGVELVALMDEMNATVAEASPAEAFG
ncbi:DUF1858 domain-containing protein [Candidatus Methylomirabilis sp.]|uniref:DUF1858 domain-containing protein n=1 Tax=Candidatus Methylomirabilis tolerans TaxID=3123416 RepID=A0AAJ1AK16_9BACT|nr:DUF1858 domain-containing protein [Candidatus Methylomirabilis sp.]